jgi:hypothetical protein
METGKSNCQTCTSLIRLCGGLDYLSPDVEVRKMLVERLHRYARDHDHAKAMIERWIETQTTAPKVADLKALANEVRSDADSLPEGCRICNGQPWITTERGATRCVCARGIALRHIDRKRAEEGRRKADGVTK